MTPFRMRAFDAARRGGNGTSHAAATIVRNDGAYAGRRLLFYAASMRGVGSVEGASLVSPYTLQVYVSRLQRAKSLRCRALFFRHVAQRGMLLRARAVRERLRQDTVVYDERCRRAWRCRCREPHAKYARADGEAMVKIVGSCEARAKVTSDALQTRPAVAARLKHLPPYAFSARP